MASSIHSAVTHIQDITHKDLTTSSAQFKVPNGDAKADSTQPKPRSKYRHVAALHSKTRPSYLSHESEISPSFIGFRNLMVLTIST